MWHGRDLDLTESLRGGEGVGRMGIWQVVKN